MRRDGGQKVDDLLGRTDVEVGQRLVQQQQPGPDISACAIITRCCSPPDRFPTRESAKALAPTACSISSTADRRSALGRPMPSRFPSSPRAIRSLARIGMSGSKTIFCGT